MAALLNEPEYRRSGAGTLPTDFDFVVQGGVSHGELCDWCGVHVEPQTPLAEVLWVRAGPVLATAFLHPTCYEVWRSILSTLPGA